MDPNQSQQEAPYLSQDPEPPQEAQPSQPGNKYLALLSKYKIPIIAIIILIIILIPSIALTTYLIRSFDDNSKLSSSGEFKEFRKGFTSDIFARPVNFITRDLDEIDYRVSNNSENIDDVVQIGCSNWEPDPSNPNSYTKYPVNSLNIVYGVIGRGDFWSASLIKDDLKIGQPVYFPLFNELDSPRFARAYGFVDFYDYDSGEYNSKGSITVAKFEGCEMGNEVEFSINVILGQDDFEEDNNLGLQLIGDFKGKVNVVDENGPFTPLIKEEEFKSYLKKREEVKEMRLEEAKKRYLDEYGYDEDYSNYFVDELEPENDTPTIPIQNNTKRRSDVTQILNAIGAFAADNSGELPSGITVKEREISDFEADICSDLVGIYIPSLPIDPDLYNGDEKITSCIGIYETGYLVSVGNGGRITVSAPFAQEGEVITNTR